MQLKLLFKKILFETTRKNISLKILRNLDFNEKELDYMFEFLFKNHSQNKNPFTLGVYSQYVIHPPRNLRSTAYIIAKALLKSDKNTIETDKFKAILYIDNKKSQYFKCVILKK